MDLPHYYTSLRAFQSVFQEGRPLLTYHHVGPRRRGARIKGLYVSPKLFATQMAELHSAGFSTRSYCSVIDSASPNSKTVYLTFDDGFRDVFQHALPILRDLRFRGIQFLVSELIGKTNEWQNHAGDICELLMDEHEVKDWIAAGHEIGAHTRTHARLTQIPIASAREEILGSKKSLEDRFGLPIHHFCYPYGDWNETIRNLVSDAGYQTACTTIPGINTSSTSPFELKRFTARYASRNWKSIWARCRSMLSGKET